jgi:hypothetical protein
MNAIASQGAKVTWKWWNGISEGKIKKIYTSKVTISIKGNQVTRFGSPENPVYLIEEENGIEVLKLSSEIEQFLFV